MFCNCRVDVGCRRQVYSNYPEHKQCAHIVVKGHTHHQLRAHQKHFTLFYGLKKHVPRF